MPDSKQAASVARVIPKLPAISLKTHERMLGKGGKEHKYLQHLVKHLAEERGFRASIEGQAAYGTCDVLLRREGLTVGCEICVTTDTEHELANVKKCHAAGFDTVLVIVSERKRRDKLKKLLGAPEPSALVIGPEELVDVLDVLAIPWEADETIRGYTVKMKRRPLDPNEVASRRSAIAEVVARSMKR